MSEIWKDVVGYEGLYQVSNLGRVKALGRTLWVDSKLRAAHPRIRKERILTDESKGRRYYHVTLYHLGEKYGGRTVSIHRLVAEAFLPNPDNLPCINHKDEDKHNNRADNLEWCTHKYNSNYGTVRQRIGRRGVLKSQSIPIAKYTLDGKLIRVYESFGEAKRDGYCTATIRKYMCGEFKRAYGFHWELADKQLTRGE